MNKKSTKVMYGLKAEVKERCDNYFHCYFCGNCNFKPTTLYLADLFYIVSILTTNSSRIYIMNMFNCLHVAYKDSSKYKIKKIRDFLLFDSKVYICKSLQLKIIKFTKKSKSKNK